MVAVSICFMTLAYVILRRIIDDGFMGRKVGRNWSSFVLKQYFRVFLAELESHVRTVGYHGENLMSGIRRSGPLCAAMILAVLLLSLNTFWSENRRL
jgi:hypothetical protein